MVTFLPIQDFYSMHLLICVANESLYIVNKITMCMCSCVSLSVTWYISVCPCVSVCLCVIIWQKNDQAGGPETYFNFAWPYIFSNEKSEN